MSTVNSASPSEHTLPVRGLEMRYLDWGGDGPTLLALHGLASSAHWYDTVAPLLRERFRIIAPNQRGHGRTTQASTGYDWPSLSADAIGLLDALGIEKASVAGHSWGGNVAVAAAALYAERVQALILIDGGFFTPRFRPNVTWEDFKARLAPRIVSGTRDEYLDFMKSGQLSGCWSDEIARILMTMVNVNESGQVEDILTPANHAQVITAMWNDPSSEYWAEISCPTLITPAGPSPERAGSEFAVARKAMVTAAAQSIPNCSVSWIANTIHDIGWHRPRELADAIREFLG